MVLTWGVIKEGGVDAVAAGTGARGAGCWPLCLPSLLQLETRKARAVVVAKVETSILNVTIRSFRMNRAPVRTCTGPSHRERAFMTPTKEYNDIRHGATGCPSTMSPLALIQWRVNMDVIADLSTRWLRARLAALGAVLKKQDSDANEAVLVAEALELDGSQTLKTVFDNSRRLGVGFRAHFDVDVPLSDIARLLPRMNVPCHVGEWIKAEEPYHFRSERSGCALGKAHPLACAYVREATDGLVLGLSSSVHFARHASLGAGDARCVDVLFVQPTPELRFGPIPDALEAPLEQVAQTIRAFDSTSTVQFLGVSEGVLFYTLSSSGEPGRVSVGPMLQRALKRRCGSLEARDITPKSVSIS